MQQKVYNNYVALFSATIYGWYTYDVYFEWRGDGVVRKNEMLSDLGDGCSKCSGRPIIDKKSYQ